MDQRFLLLINETLTWRKDVNSQSHDELEVLKSWWHENWMFLTGGLVVSFSAVFGWNAWQDHKAATAEAASNVYNEIISIASVGKMAELQALSTQLKSDYASTPYAVQAALRMAEVYATNNDYEAAAGELRWAMENTDDATHGLVARYRLAQVMLTTGNTDEVVRLMASVDAGEMQGMFDELRGDALFVAGDKAAAKEAWTKALAGMPAGLGDRQLLEMKLNNIDMPESVLAVNAASEGTE